MAALAYLDTENSTNIAARYVDPWHQFVGNKLNWNLDRYIERFTQQMNSIRSLGTPPKKNTKYPSK